MSLGVDKRDVAAELSAELVLEHFAIPFRGTGGELRFQTCPACGPRGRTDAVAISYETGRWLDPRGRGRLRAWSASKMDAA